MGKISRQLAARFRDFHELFASLRAEATKIADSIVIPNDVKNIEEHVKAGLEPLHAAYAAAQNLTSSFAERVAGFDEFTPYYRIVGAAQDEYMPGSPPMSPLTTSYFTTWAFYDCRFGPDLETIGTCLLDVSEHLDLDGGMVEIIRLLGDSRMGIYEHRGMEGSRCRLQELVMGEVVTAHVPTGYVGQPGELWYVRLCPPAFDLIDYHVAFTTPYILLNTTKEDWTAFLRKTMLGGEKAVTRDRLHELMKYGREPNDWSEFIFQAYHHHQFDAIFLAGLPDVQASRPHGNLARPVAPRSVRVNPIPRPKRSARKGDPGSRRRGGGRRR